MKDAYAVRQSKGLILPKGLKTAGSQDSDLQSALFSYFTFPHYLRISVVPINPINTIPSYHLPKGIFMVHVGKKKDHKGNPMGTGIDHLRVLSDERGVVFEPLDMDSFPYQRNAHVVISEPGVIRGNHFHREGNEIVAVMGSALVRYQEDGKIRDVTIPEGLVYRFTFPPEIPHAIKNTSSSPNILVAFNTMAHDLDNPDTVKHVLIGS